MLINYTKHVLHFLNIVEIGNYSRIVFCGAILEKIKNVVILYITFCSLTFWDFWHVYNNFFSNIGRSYYYFFYYYIIIIFILDIHFYWFNLFLNTCIIISCLPVVFLSTSFPIFFVVFFLSIQIAEVVTIVFSIREICLFPVILYTQTFRLKVNIVSVVSILLGT